MAASLPMDPELKKALFASDVRLTITRATYHADTTIRKYIWRGHRRKYSETGEVMVGDKTANDFVSEAIQRLIKAQRTFNPNRSLLDNLNSITDSLISSEKKSSDRTGVIDFVDEEGFDGGPTNPISKAMATEATPDEKLRTDELSEDQRRCIKLIWASFDGDDRMQSYIDALGAGFKRPEIAELIGISSAEVDELRRKLVKHAARLFGVISFNELQQRLNEGN